ncbi:TPA: hypothetical protein N0F65_010567, partial [Lagenidium giganteum]
AAKALNLLEDDNELTKHVRVKCCASCDQKDAGNNSPGNVFFVDGPGGTGKTYLNKTLIQHFVSKTTFRIIWLGRHTDARRKDRALSIQRLDESSTCSISVQSPLAELIRRISMIVWDEATMRHRNVFEAVDRTLPLGNKVVLLGGDFCQILPVVKHGDRGDIVHACVTSSYIWSVVR